MKAAIKERPILFNGEMVRAILSGQKTQTRRLMKPQPVRHSKRDLKWEWRPKEGSKSYARWNGDTNSDHCQHCGLMAKHSPFGMMGDQLWVRETWEPLEFSDHEIGVQYAATPYSNTRKENDTYWFTVGEDEVDKWTARSGKRFPNIHMPRWASRITLEVTNVRVERLNEISASDCLLEGIDLPVPANCETFGHARPEGFSDWSASKQEDWVKGIARSIYFARCADLQNHIDAFAKLWESISGPGSWKQNPWVWVIEFKKAAHAT